MIAVFVRPATPGRTKTRLIPALGPERAALLYRAMACDVLAQACAVPGRVVEVWVAGALQDPDLDFAPPALVRASQPDGSLASRILHTLEVGLVRHGPTMVLGSDAPGLSHLHLEAAFGRLREADVVLGPSADGGYTLIAARRSHPRMFEGVRMSTRHALSDTRNACLHAGLSVALTTPWFDVDRPADLTTLHGLLALSPGLAPHTAAALGLFSVARVLTASPPLR